MINEVLRRDLFFVHAHAVSTSKAFSVVKREKLMLNSRYYYQKTYGHCSVAELSLLKVAMRIYLLELRCIIAMRKGKS